MAMHAQGQEIWAALSDKNLPSPYHSVIGLTSIQSAACELSVFWITALF